MYFTWCSFVIWRFNYVRMNELYVRMNSQCLLDSSPRDHNLAHSMTNNGLINIFYQLKRDTCTCEPLFYYYKSYMSKNLVESSHDAKHYCWSVLYLNFNWCKTIGQCYIWIVLDVTPLDNAIGCWLYFLTNDLYLLDTHNAIVSEM